MIDISKVKRGDMVKVISYDGSTDPSNMPYGFTKGKNYKITQVNQYNEIHLRSESHDVIECFFAEELAYVFSYDVKEWTID